jgi:aminobenzoyl-glutamate utilization protein B
MQNTDQIWSLVEAKRDAFEALSDRVFDAPEIAFTEYKAVAEHTAMLEREGFRITTDLAGIPTTVMGEAGAGGPVIAILGEYDALPGLAQESGVAEPKPLPGDGIGHGCGHNLLGAGALLAATAVKDWLAANGKPGCVRYYGCPAEEGGAAKSFMVRAGVFDDVDIAITWHAMPFCGVNDALALANTRIDFSFTGRASHAAAAPHLGRSALDAVELMNVGVNYMREHMPSDARIHYALLDAGGVAPNVVQGHAKVRYAVRARDIGEMQALLARVQKCAQGAALMTETRMEARIISAVSNLVGNTPLERAMQDNWERLGPPDFDEADRTFAGQIRATLSEDDIRAPYRRAGLAFRRDQPLADEIVPFGLRGERLLGSTDVGDVSWVVPLVQADGPTIAIGTPFHSWQLTAHGKTPLAKKGMVQTAKVMAATAIDALQDATLVARAKADLQERTREAPYVCPIPPDVQPPIRPR